MAGHAVMWVGQMAFRNGVGLRGTARHSGKLNLVVEATLTNERVMNLQGLASFYIVQLCLHV